jgi:galactokinase
MTALTNGDQLYQTHFGTPPKAASQAPGRIEILGNHTDYNGGFVLTVAIENVIALYGEPTGDDTITVYSATMDDETRFSTQSLTPDPAHSWANYIKGVVQELKKAGVSVPGFKAIISDNLPIGGGISSSAALEAATAYFIKAIAPYEMEKMEIAKICQKAENNFVGMPCGILDQFSSIFGQKGAFLFLDCDTLEHKAFPIQEPLPSLVLTNSMVKHSLVEGEYKSRREQCESAASVMAERLGRPVRLLRDITLKEFVGLEDILSTKQRMRAGHVMFENQRVQVGVKALENNDLARLGQMMHQSHCSSRDKFENTCPELDILVEEAMKIDGCLGSRMTGGGFGGCTVSLVAPQHTDHFVSTMKERSAERLQKESDIMVCNIGQGAEILLSL